MSGGATTAIVELTAPATWGRASTAGWDKSIGAILVVAAVPTWLHMNWIALEQYQGSITAALKAALHEGPVNFAFGHFPRFSLAAVVGYAGWLLLQAFFYGYLPGTLCYGQRTPGGHLLTYTANGLLAWAITHALYIGGSFLGYLDPALIANHWEGLLVAVNTYGFVLAILAQWKGYWAPSYPEDRKISGSWFFDFWAGVELNPRFGKSWDFKFFHNGRPGIVAWTLIDFSWAAYQYQQLGHVTASIVIVSMFHLIYVVDFFYNEDWYTRTIDISHDHFGFMLAWGDTTFLPCLYTLQVQYLARYPVYLTRTQSVALIVLGLTGYTIFRSANYQRDYVRARNGDCELWGKPVECIRCKYTTSDGKQHSSLLLLSGWWGVCRHMNYAADLLLSWSMCATCGFDHFVPWSYFFFMSILLYHRSLRDDKRCHQKYGKAWEEYCRRVPYKIIPGVL